MKKKSVLLIVLFFIASCSEQKTAEFKTPDYKNWKKPFKTGVDYPVPGHGASYRVVYANEIAYLVKREREQGGRRIYTYLDGSIIVKEVHKSKGDVDRVKPALYAMVKNSKATGSAKGWLYYVISPDGKITRIKSRMCSGCHESANERHNFFDGNIDEDFRDYLFTNFYKL